MKIDDILFTFLEQVLAQYYSTERIFFAFQNDITYPDDWNMVLITRQGMTSPSTGASGYDAKTGRRHYRKLNKINYQVDIYGEHADEASLLLYNTLTCARGADLLRPVGIGVGEVRDVMNLTAADKKDVWIPRYVLNFELMQNSIIGDQVDGFDTVGLNIYGVDSDFPVRKRK